MNLLQGSYFMAATTAVFCGVGILTYISCHFYNNRTPAIYAIILSCMVLMTYYAVTGENEGFAILWTMIVPSAVMFLGGVKLGISLSLYYWCLFVVLFYTPFRSCVAGQYTETFMNRYPVIYMCAIMINSAAMIRYHISVLNDMEYNERLTNEVQRLTAIEIERRQQMERLLSYHMKLFYKTLTKGRKTNTSSGESVRTGWDNSRLKYFVPGGLDGSERMTYKEWMDLAVVEYEAVSKNYNYKVYETMLKDPDTGEMKLIQMTLREVLLKCQDTNYEDRIKNAVMRCVYTGAQFNVEIRKVMDQFFGV